MPPRPDNERGKSMSHPLFLPLTLADFGWEAAVLGLIGLAVGGGVVALIIRQLGVKTIAQARDEGARIVADSRKDAESAKKETALNFRAEMTTKREEFEKEINQARNELKENERRLTKREDNLD